MLGSRHSESASPRHRTRILTNRALAQFAPGEHEPGNSTTVPNLAAPIYRAGSRRIRSGGFRAKFFDTIRAWAAAAFAPCHLGPNPENLTRLKLLSCSTADSYVVLRTVAKRPSGRGGIRTPGTLRHAGFQDRCIRPLCHPTNREINDESLVAPKFVIRHFVITSRGISSFRHFHLR